MRLQHVRSRTHEIPKDRRCQDIVPAACPQTPFPSMLLCTSDFRSHPRLPASQVKKALLSSSVSLLFTTVVTVLAFTKMRDMENGTAHYRIPVFALAVLDNAVSLGAIVFAVHLPSATSERGASSRSRGSGVTSFGSNRSSA